MTGSSVPKNLTKRLYLKKSSKSKKYLDVSKVWLTSENIKSAGKDKTFILIPGRHRHPVNSNLYHLKV